MDQPQLENDPLTERIMVLGSKYTGISGRGCFEASYEQCLSWGIPLGEQPLVLVRQPLIPIIYNGRRPGSTYRPDFVIERKVIVEVKAVDRLLDVHHAQLLTYLRITGLAVGLLLNFNSAVLRNGIKRLSL